MNKVRTGCKLTYQGNVLYCNHKRTLAENTEVCKVALIALLGYNPFKEPEQPEFERIYGLKCEFELRGGTLESYSAS